ncbi:MAG: sigma-70 family RNA polymerase sigma factor [Oscillospiraceae bacterium]|jgi:RNA polymerase sporulation-specific sigma factor|nr:sigma-70 family RNA polymerase sigma factor [Oscillospiraceae bacterium]
MTAQAQRQNTEARNAFVEANMGLVYSCARRLQGRGAEFEDLVQAGCVGLIKAADAFDASRGLAFSTYAVPVIFGEIKRLFREGGAVKVGRTTKERARELLQRKDRLTEELGREPSVGELARAADLDVSETAVLLGAAMPVLSLTATDNNGQPEWEIPVDSPAGELADKIALRQVLQELDGQEQRLIECRFFRSMTQARTAELLGMTQVQVSRKEKAILKRLRGDLLA